MDLCMHSCPIESASIVTLLLSLWSTCLDTDSEDEEGPTSLTWKEFSQQKGNVGGEGREGGWGSASVASLTWLGSSPGGDWSDKRVSSS